ncbi:LOW QUALITY PROTEIN: uncharacterized protein ACMZJ9_004824 [Mantella aurantiaca]
MRQTSVQEVLEENSKCLKKLIEDHEKTHKVMSSRSRCIDGSTLLHVAAYFGDHQHIETLLQLQVDVDLLEYKGATPLQCSKDKKTMQFSQGASTRKCNKKGLLPVHCAALQGRQVAIQAILEYGINEREFINKYALEQGTPSLPYMALINGHLECTKWKNNLESVEYLLSNGMDVNIYDKRGNRFILVKGASLKLQDNEGLTAFDHVKNTDDWIECGTFSNELLKEEASPAFGFSLRAKTIPSTWDNSISDSYKGTEEGSWIEQVVAECSSKDSQRQQVDKPGQVQMVLRNRVREYRLMSDLAEVSVYTKSKRIAKVSGARESSQTSQVDNRGQSSCSTLSDNSRCCLKLAVSLARNKHHMKIARAEGLVSYNVLENKQVFVNGNKCHLSEQTSAS